MCPQDAATIFPNGLIHREGFITDEESSLLLNLIAQNEWSIEGFEQRRRVQRYNLFDKQNDNDEGSSDNNVDTTKSSRAILLCHLESLIDRLLDTFTSEKSNLSLRPNEIVIEERKAASGITSISHQNSSTKYDDKDIWKLKRRPIASTFESNIYSKDEFCSHCYKQTTGDILKKRCTCYVAQISLASSCKLSMNKPKERNIECWDLESPKHMVEVLMNSNDLVVRRDESLWNWRSRIEINNDSVSLDDEKEPIENNEESKIIIIKFRCIQGEKNQGEVESNANDEYESIRADIASKPLHELLTIIVTTSPIKSNPSTELLEQTFQTFIHGGVDFCFNCEKVIICDGVRIQKDDSNNDVNDNPNKETNAEYRPKVTKKHANTKQCLRNGIATSDQADNYIIFKEKMVQICEEAGKGILNTEEMEEDTKSLLENISPFRNTRIVQLEERHGYGFALRHALRHEVKTPFVCVIQHDRTFMRRTPIFEVVQAMRHSSGRVKYVGMSMRSNLWYREIFLGKYGRVATNELLEMVIKPPELLLSSSSYGPKGVSAKDMVVVHEKMEKNLLTLAQTYQSTLQFTSHYNNDENEKDGKHQLSLTPTLFWYDNTHICETSHYRDFIFDPRYKMVARGGFVEDKLSPVITRSIERLGLKEGHSRFGCYLLDDHSGYFFTGHLDGGSFITTTERNRLLATK